MEFPYNPMTEYVPQRTTAELLALEAKLSAQMPYRQVVDGGFVRGRRNSECSDEASVLS